MMAQLLSNWVCWAIVLTALYCYQHLALQLLQLRGLDEQLEQRDAQFSQLLIGTMPLLGLLGTIIGLLDCFMAMSEQGNSGYQLSQGIGDALLTTELGLVCAIPGWLLQGYLRHRQHSAVLMQQG
ncbi:hypothetical protein GCM10009092_20250 [Bowmanella denitrificans]|uniref:MotA/TolQ/ExbB proton channel domain-containing protein n=1 Tax=Bowmanella denitrificans TaxID=366582 RepID=A0ABN0X5V1_9ALTE|nr:MotA/TolQ/ExbB proton channel family protein [Bowmanella denitrificans]